MPLSLWQTQNWSGHTPFTAARFHRPTTVAQVQEIVRRATKVRVIGSRHCFNDIADTEGDLLWLGDLDKTAVIDAVARTATVHAGVTYEELCPQLQAAGFALPNLPSLKHVTVIGACMTSTHGSGNALGQLATAISRLEIVNASGELIGLSRARDGDTFLAAAVSLGALGVVVRLTLDLVPAFLIQQDCYEKLPIGNACAHFDEISSAGYSVSLFTSWSHDWIDTVWVKQRVPTLTPVAAPPALHGASLASSNPAGERPLDRTLTPFATPGIWHERLPHYAFHDASAVGNELQSDYFVPRRNAVAAIRAVDALRAGLAPILGLSEIRTIRADDLWLSCAYAEDAIGVHFNWLKKWDDIRPFLPVLEAALAPFGARPHFGKLFAMSPTRLAEVYPRWNDFRALVRRVDPSGKFANRFIRRHLFAEPGA